MPQFIWNENTPLQWRYWEQFPKLLNIVKSIDGPIINTNWLQDELTVVGQKGLSSYFIELFNSNLIYSNPQSSSLAYFLYITDEPPQTYPSTMLLDMGRISAPDIDLDFDDRYRDQVVEYARQKYGSERLSHICTFNRIGARSAVRDAARVLGYEYAVGDKIAKLVPPPVQGFAKSLNEALENPDLKKLYESDQEAHHVIEAAKGLEGLIRQTGVHAAGIVIAQSEITNFLPIMQKGKDAPIVTQWEDDRVDQCGKLKIDFLGLRNLAVIDISLQLIKERRNQVIDINTIPLDDLDTYKTLCNGETIGLFQIESGGIRQLTMSLKPDCIEDLMAIIALYRPGPLGSKMDKAFIARKHGREPVTYDHPALKDILKDTYGLMIYQEHILNIARGLAGFSIGEADDLRKAVGKKLRDKIGLFRNKFIEGCRKTHNVDSKTANKIYSEIEYFGSYGFNIAHAASYAVIAYWTTWLKTHYPVEYMAALLTSIDDKDRIGIYISECRRMNLTVYTPSINYSRDEFTVLSDNEMLFGLGSIGGVGKAYSDAILRSRTEPYKNIYDFMRRIDTDILNKGTIDALIESGALDDLVDEQPITTISRDERTNILVREKNRLGTYVSDHPVLGIWSAIEQDVTHTTQQLDSVFAGEVVTLGGMIEKVIRKVTKRGDTMYILRLEDIDGPIEIVAFPRETRRFEEKFIEGSPAIISGRLQSEEDEEASIIKLILTDIRLPEISQYQSGTPIRLCFAEEPPPAILDKIANLIEFTPGDSPVFLEYPSYGHTITLRMKKPTSISIEHNLQLLTLKERRGL